MAADGMTNRAIADELYISVRTAETHVLRVCRKLAVADRAELTDLLQGKL